MNHLKQDALNIEALISTFSNYALDFLKTQKSRPAVAGIMDLNEPPYIDIDLGIGAQQALQHFLALYEPSLSGSTGPNYYGFVTGGSTPAGLVGDWLTSLFDQNAMGSPDSIAPSIELQAVKVFCDLLGLEDHFSGSFVTGATMSSFVGLSTARHWVARKNGIDSAKQGLYGMKPIKVFSATPHSSIYKCLSMCGIGRDHLVRVPTLPNREAIDVVALESLIKIHQEPCIVVANSGTVNTVDFDNLLEIVELKSKYDFWLHVDAAFGGVAGCSEMHRHLIKGINFADSIAVDAHKWLNVPYDCAIQLSQHLPLQREVFLNSASYLSSVVDETNYVDLTPENSRRLRAVTVWMSIVAYGKNGYSEIINRNVECAKKFGRLVEADKDFVLLAPVMLNGVCFTLSTVSSSDSLEHRVGELLKKVQSDGTFFLTGTNYLGKPAIRLSVSNWQTEQNHIVDCFNKLKLLLG